MPRNYIRQPCINSLILWKQNKEKKKVSDKSYSQNWKKSLMMAPKPGNQQPAPKPKPKNKDTCLVCKTTCKEVASNKQGSIRCSVCQYWYHPNCAGVTQEEFKMCVKWKEMRGVDIWACTPCTSANENLDKMVRELNSKVEEVKRTYSLGRQAGKGWGEGEAEGWVGTQSGYWAAALRERMTKLEANSGNSVLKEIDERKLRENNVIIHRLPEAMGDTAFVKREDDQNRV